MIRKLILFYLVIACGLLTAGEKDPLKKLSAWMTGSFNSAEQAASDEAFYDINLEMHRIWADRTDGYWLYVEQALSSKQEKPYRQRVYHVKAKDQKTFVSVVYTLPNEEHYIGAQNEQSKFAALKPEDLILRDGCDVVLALTPDGNFNGSTVDKECTSSLRGATYATSEIVIKDDRIISWDRGFDASDNHVWGAEKGGYIFMRK